MQGIYINQFLDSKMFRESIFSGNIFLFSEFNEITEICNYAKSCIYNAFKDLDPETAQYNIKVTDFIDIIAPLKKQFTNSLEVKHIMRSIIKKLNHDINDIYFDLPRLRVIPAGNYLTSGVSYAYKPHRDTWYSGSQAQINFWLPVFPIVIENAMAIFPSYWSTSVKNSSNNFDYDNWVANDRPRTEELITKDDRTHPLPLEDINNALELRFAGKSGELLAFSAAHLHGSAPNTSDKTRFSIDFRIISKNDLINKRGAHNVDSAATGSTLIDFICAADFSELKLNGNN